MSQSLLVRRQERIRTQGILDSLTENGSSDDLDQVSDLSQPYTPDVTPLILEGALNS